MSTQTVTGQLRKMRVELQSPVDYYLPIDEEEIHLNPFIGSTIKLEYNGKIFCVHCNRKTNKSFNQGYCFPCFRKLAQCDSCIMSPEKCHYDKGTCREPEWGEEFCMQDHYVYLANSSGVKVGITRGNQIPTRWIDQGAIQALPIFRVSTRLQSGLVEVLFKQHVADKTNWRTMLKGGNPKVDLLAERDHLMAECAEGIEQLQQQYGLQAISALPDSNSVDIEFPVTEYPAKVTSLNLVKTPVIEGVLMGIKGQYLIFDTGVLNIRNLTAHDVTITVPSA